MPMKEHVENIKVANACITSYSESGIFDQLCTKIALTLPTHVRSINCMHR